MRSLTLKLTLAFLLLGVTGAVLVAVLVRQRTRSAFDQFILNREQQALVESLAAYYQINGSWAGVERSLTLNLTPSISPAIEHNPRLAGMHFTLISLEKKVVFSDRPDQLGRQASDAELSRALPLVVNGSQVGWLLQTANPRQAGPGSPEGVFLANVNRSALLSALVAAFLALALGGFLAFTMTRSLRELTEATVEIARGKLGLQVKVRSKDEIGQLASAFNQMSLDLARATHARHQMTADIAHDLRSPLSVISGYAEALVDKKLQGSPEVFEILDKETRHLSHLIDDLRVLSLADAGELPLNRLPADPAALLEWVAARHKMTAEQKGIALRIEIQGQLPKVEVDEERMAQVLDNLILNAFRYTPEGGEILLGGKTAAGRVELFVRDSGSGIAAEDLPHVFDRFYRGDKARTQNGESGLGLAIARSIVAAHGGKISVESAEGQGTEFRISLPMIGQTD